MHYRRHDGDLDTTPEALDEAFHFNVASPFELTRQATPYLLSSGRASVINITSRMDRLAARGMMTYGTVVAAFSQLTRILAASRPAKTESGGNAGSANIVTTLTMACRRAPADREPGRANLVEAELKREVKARVSMGETAGLALPDQRMASAGPAMEIVGRYSEVLDHLGEPVDPERYLLVVRRAVDEAAAIEIIHLPLETLHLRTGFASSWVRDYCRVPAPKSDARWQALAADLEMDRDGAGHAGRPLSTRPCCKRDDRSAACPAEGLPAS